MWQKEGSWMPPFGWFIVRCNFLTRSGRLQTKAVLLWKSTFIFVFAESTFPVCIKFLIIFRIYLSPMHFLHFELTSILHLWYGRSQSQLQFAQLSASCINEMTNTNYERGRENVRQQIILVFKNCIFWVRYTCIFASQQHWILGLQVESVRVNSRLVPRAPTARGPELTKSTVHSIIELTKRSADLNYPETPKMCPSSGWLQEPLLCTQGTGTIK